jgi:hypothetical protein
VEGDAAMKIRVNVIEPLFNFLSQDDWIRNAQKMFRAHGHTSQSTLCVDADGLICVRGKQFSVAKYPVMVYAIDDAPYETAGMTGKRKPSESHDPTGNDQPNPETKTGSGVAND